LCGIAGIFGRPGRQVCSDDLKRMTDALAHRGPDAEGLWCSPEGDCGLGHRRLSIIDLSEKANQPMADSAHVLHVVFNGEIYNHAELRAELERDFPFQTDHSDTETILYAYRKWGMRFLERASGMFAIALYDAGKRKLYLIRDRFGKKPLYYTTWKDCLYFSSEIGAFLDLPGFPRQPNAKAVYDYLTFLAVRPPETFFEGINKVKASHYVEAAWDNDQLRIAEHAYWDIADYLNTVKHVSYGDAAEMTDHLLRRSVRYRNVSDVPVAVSLSGGLDSSLNLALSFTGGAEVHAINISYDHGLQSLDESPYAERLARERGVDFISCRIGNREFMSSLSELAVRLRDVPVVWPDMVLMHIISRKLHQSAIKVVLVGEGGDELGAYPDYFQLLRMYRRFNALKLLLRPSLLHLASCGRRMKRRLDYIYDGRLISRRHIHAFSEMEKSRFWRGPRVRNSYEEMADIMDEVLVDGEEGFIRKVLNLEYKLRLPEVLLPRIDYATMVNSVEARAPLLDHDLVSQSMMIPFPLRNCTGPKALMREVAGRYLPQYILNRPKSGFGVEFSTLLTHEFNDWFHEEIIAAKPAPIEQYVDRSYLVRMYRHNLRKKGDVGYAMWVLFALNRWLGNNFHGGIR
jgi:asparagine synthase (glutamine-hydrolysing)